MNSHMLVSSEIDIGLNKSNIERPPGSKKRTKRMDFCISRGFQLMC
jgi:hypothetical protein